MVAPPAGGGAERAVAFGVTQNVGLMRRALTPATAWRRLPLALQLAIAVVTVTVAWGVVDLSLSVKRARTTAAYGTALARLDRAEVQVLELFALLVDARAALTAPETPTDPRDAERLGPLDRQARTRLDSLQLLAPSGGGVADAVVAWRAAYEDWRTLWSNGTDDILLEQARFDLARRQSLALRRTVDAERGQLAELAADADRLASRERFLLRIAAIGVGLLLIILVSRRVATTLDTVVTAAEALAQGRYAAVRLPSGTSASSSELQRLAVAYEELARAVASREEALQNELQALKQVEEMKTEFVSMVSHELRTPLTSIRGALGLLLSGTVGQRDHTCRRIT
jgi:signal transduction histidine kinase